MVEKADKNIRTRLEDGIWWKLNINIISAVELSVPTTNKRNICRDGVRINNNINSRDQDGEGNNVY